MTDDAFVPPSPSEAVPAELLDRYLAGEAAPGERSIVEQWARTAPRVEAVILRLGAALRARHADVVAEAPGTHRAVDARIDALLAGDRRRDPAPRPARWWTPGRIAVGGAAVAAAVAVAVLVGRRQTTEPAFTAAQRYETASGQRATITLADGSRVTLAPASHLEIGAGYGGRSRTVALVGEAYFDVRGDARAPFAVRTGTVVTRVLGTAFAVRRYPADEAVSVSVVRGKVIAAGPHAAATLAAGWVGVVTDSTAKSWQAADIGARTAWLDGRLVFEDTPVAAMLEAVGRWYGYDFRLADSALAQRRVIATFRTDEPAKTLSAIRSVLNVTMTFDGATVVVQPSRAAAAPARPDVRVRIAPHTEVGK